MRLKRLDLTRYGKFTDYSIDFGEREPDRPDLHIVYGPNEAGKSTSLAAFLDLLYGIEPRSRFNFVHPYPVMRIGATLEFGEQVLELARVKRAQNDLLDAGGLPVAEAAIAGQLGGIDRESYRAMFSLDDDTLEAGGESILASKGDLGELLFSASTGLADLSRALVDLRAEADGFYRYHARTGALAALKARLAELKEERDRLDTAASGYAQLIEARDRALGQYEEALAGRTAIQSRMDEIQRILNALPRLIPLRSAREQLLALADLPAAPVGWAAALPALQEDDITLALRSDEVDRDVERKLAELQAVSVDEAALKIADRVDGVADLQARYVTAAKDIPVRRVEVRQADLAITGLLARLGREGDADPQRLIFDTATVGSLQELIGKQSGIETANQAAAKELSDARQRLEETTARLREAGGEIQAQGNDAGFTALAVIVAALRSDDHAVRRRNADRSRAACLAELADRMPALRPWQGDIEQLASLTVPAQSEILQWKTALQAAQKRHDRCKDDAEQLQTEQLRLAAERDAIVGIAGVVSDQDAARIRAAREVAWANHRTRLDAASADLFEAELRHDDAVQDARLRHQTDVAKLHQAAHALALAEAKASRAQELFDAAAAALRCVRDEITASIIPLLSGGTSIAQFEAWLGQREKALETRKSLRQAERDLEEAESDAADARRRVAEALDTVQVGYDADAGFDALRVIAQGVLDREAALKALRTELEERRRDVKARERNLATALERDRAWCAAWGEACSNSWLAETRPSPAIVGEILPALAALGHELEKRASLIDRIDNMEHDQREFAGEVAAIAGELDFVSDTDSPLDLAKVVTDRVQQARTALTQRENRTRALEEARERQDALATERAVHARRAAEMMDFFAVGSLASVAARLSAIETKTALQRQESAATLEILDTLRLPSIEAAEAVLDSADRTALDTELLGLQARFADQDRRTHDLFAQHSKAVDRVEAVGGDAAVARIEEQRRTVLLEVEDGARRYLTLRVGIVAAEHALRSYRQQHRSSMMAHASGAFRTISRDAYSGLASQPNKDNEILIAVAADGTSKIASELSKGTRFQLYLALRVAGYHEFARIRPPVPFIADDIMETFDDLRAEEALGLLANMGKVGQVIYLTHHRHLCEIARRTCPGVRIHQLSLSPT
jgi:uncharacterized protein YhaN